MNQIISLSLVGLGLTFLLTPTFIVNKDDTNYFSSIVHEYNQFIGLFVLFIAYLYSDSHPTSIHPFHTSTDSVSTISSENTHITSSHQNASY